MKDLINNIKFNRLPEEEQFLIRLLDDSTLYYHVDDINLIYLISDDDDFRISICYDKNINYLTYYADVFLPKYTDRYPTSKPINDHDKILSYIYKRMKITDTNINYRCLYCSPNISDVLLKLRKIFD